MTRKERKALKKQYKELKEILMPNGMDEDDLELEDGFLMWALKEQIKGRFHPEDDCGNS